MSRQSQTPYRNGNIREAEGPEDASDVEKEAMTGDYQEQVQYDDDGMDDPQAYGASAQDIQAQLQAAVQPLERDATLETKFASYDNYCSLFHYILNSEGPVELELPSVRFPRASTRTRSAANSTTSSPGHGT